MENASKALIMAATILIGVMILSLGVYLFVSFGESARKMHAQNEQKQIEEFNSNFLKYDGKDVTIYDIITMLNLAEENNQYYELTPADAKETTFYIKVTIGGTTSITNSNYEDILENDLKNMENGTLPTYKCKVDVSSYTNRVYKVTFSKNG